MDVMAAIKKRRSVRAYEKRRVPQDLLEELLEAARLAPSASNEEWHFVVVLDPEKVSEVAASASQSFVAEAPVLIVGVSLNPSREMPCEVPAYAVDLGIALTNITLAAVSKGLGTCWIGAFNQEGVKKSLGIPQQYKIVALLTLGYPLDDPGLKTRKALEELVSYDYFTG